MTTRSWLGLCAVLVVVSFASGLALAKPRPEPAVAPVVARPAPSPERRTAPPVTAARTAQAGDAGLDELRLRWCEAQVERAASASRAARLPWPEDDLGNLDPDRFPDVAEQAAAACGARVEVSECAEYPCVSVVDLGGQTKDELEACPALLEAFGAVYVDEVPRMCPDGSVTTVPVLVPYEEQRLQEHLTQTGRDVGDDGPWFAGIEEGYRLVFRRTDAAAALAADVCGGQG